MQKYAVIAKLKLSSIEGAKTLKRGYYGGMVFAVSKDMTEDELYVIFLPDGQISKEYADANNLVRKIDVSTGGNVGGFFEENRKVRSIRLMKGTVTSVGYVAPLDSLRFTGFDVSKLKEGDAFDELNGVPICNKFLTKQTLSHKNKPKGSKDSFIVCGMPEHQDTTQFYKGFDSIPVGSTIILTLKLDGTSFRVANGYVKRKKHLLERMLNKIVPTESHEFKYVYGSRRVNFLVGNANYYKKDSSVNIYKEASDKFVNMLHKGEAVYGEIVGWLNENKPIFTRGGVQFKYSCPSGTRGHYVYDIKHTLPDNTCYSLAWSQVKARCNMLGVNHVPELYPPFIFNGDYEKLQELVYGFTDGLDPIDTSHIREGVVVRVEDGNSVKFYKSKGSEYYLLEDKSKSDSKFVDIEDL